MPDIFKNYTADKTKTTAEQMDDILNRIMTQMDYLCKSADYQNKILKELYDDAGSCNKKYEVGRSAL